MNKNTKEWITMVLALVGFVFFLWFCAWFARLPPGDPRIKPLS